MSHLGFLHCRNTDNIGDISCGPEDYFTFGDYDLAYLPMEEIWHTCRLPVPCDYYILGEAKEGWEQALKEAEDI